MGGFVSFDGARKRGWREKWKAHLDTFLIKNRNPDTCSYNF